MILRHVNVPATLLSGCVLFNFVLCFINTNFFIFSPVSIILCEVILVGSAVSLSVLTLDKFKIYWLYVLLAQLLIVLLMSLAKDEFLAKSLRDMLLMPVFILLGFSAARLDMTRFVIFIVSITSLIALCEALWPEQFLHIFNFRDFYIAKGDLDVEFLLPLNTFASGIRPQGRFLFDLPDIHRISSVFLEPVSLGFFSFIISLYILSVSKYMNLHVVVLVILSCCFLIWLSDARMALGCLILSLVLKPVFQRADHRFSVFIFPAVLVVSFIVEKWNLLDKEGEGLGARLHSTMTLLSETTWDKLAGLGGYDHSTADTALGMLLDNVGITGFLLFWLAPIFFMRVVPISARVYIFGTSIYMACAFMLSSAVFTIKTASLIWFFYGYIIARGRMFEEKCQSSGTSFSQPLTKRPISSSDPIIAGPHLGS